jgi:hypothetical protein
MQLGYVFFSRRFLKNSRQWLFGSDLDVDKTVLSAAILEIRTQQRPHVCVKTYLYIYPRSKSLMCSMRTVTVGTIILYIYLYNHRWLTTIWYMMVGHPSFP